MLFIKTDTRELTINNESGEKYFDAILRMMLEENAAPAMKLDAKAPSAIQVEAAALPEKSSLPEKPAGEREEGYKGFMHITCSRCGRTKTFFAKERLKEYRCHDCDKETELIPESMRQAFTDCKCGQYSYYWTNSTEGEIDIPCVNCGAPVTVRWNSKKKWYETVKG